MRKIVFMLSTLAILGCKDNGAYSSNNFSPESRVKSAFEIKGDAADWGEFLPYFSHETHGLKNSLVGVAKLEAGQEIHPPHRHADEEYLMVTSGRGEWHVNGKTFKAEKGDILYAKPWEYHGVKAADDSELEFVVFKFSARAVEVPANVNPELPEELAE